MSQYSIMVQILAAQGWLADSSTKGGFKEQVIVGKRQTDDVKKKKPWLCQIGGDGFGRQYARAWSVCAPHEGLGYRSGRKTTGVTEQQKASEGL